MSSSYDTLVVALYRDLAAAEQAILTVRPGLSSDRIDVLSGAPHGVQSLFIPEDDYHDYHHALVRGHALVIVRPWSSDERDAVVSALELGAPIDIAQHGRSWRGNPVTVDPGTLNHATVSRADMHGRTLGGHDEVVLDMTGQKMTMRTLSDADMAAAPFAPPADPAARPAPLAPPAPDRPQPTSGTTYTYGVPLEVARRMSPEEQVLAQPPASAPARQMFHRTVGDTTHVGWRDHHPQAMYVRVYVTERMVPVDG